GARDLRRVAAQRIVLAEILDEHLGVAEDRREQVVEVVRDAARQLPDRVHLERVPELLLALAERVFGPLPFGQVADEAREQRGGARLDARDRELRRELAAVGPDGGRLEAPADQRARTGLEVP